MDLEELRGTWRVVRMEHEGRVVPAEAASIVRYVFDGDSVSLFEGDQPAGEGVIRPDPGSGPGSFAFEATAGPQAGSTARAIYRVDGDELTICIGAERPAGFRGDGVASLVHLVREGVGPEPDVEGLEGRLG